jgi:hypothetical protein
MLLIYYLGWAKIKFRKWANYDCRKQMGFIEDNYIVEQLSAAAADPAFRDSIGISTPQHPIVRVEIEHSKSHTRFTLSSEQHLNW